MMDRQLWGELMQSVDELMSEIRTGMHRLLRDVGFRYYDRSPRSGYHFKGRRDTT